MFSSSILLFNNMTSVKMNIRHSYIIESIFKKIKINILNVHKRLIMLGPCLESNHTAAR